MAELQHTTRRVILKGFALGAPCAAFAAPQAEDTPILRLFRRWDAVNADIEATAHENDAALDAHVAQLNVIEAAILAEPVTRLEDLAAKIFCHSRYGDYSELDPRIAAECEDILVRGTA